MIIGRELKGNKLKKAVLEHLCQDDFKKGLSEICSLKPAKVINPLLGLFFHQDDLIRWRSITAAGTVTANLAQNNIEAARVIMRRFMWSLNDESGGIGWGAPEAMGEIMAQHRGLALEYSKILISYICPGPNLIENVLLQRGVLWGIGRLSQTSPDLAYACIKCISPFFESEDPMHRGYCAFIIRNLKDKEGLNIDLSYNLDNILSDHAKITIFIDQRLLELKISEIALLSKITSKR